VGGGGNLSVSKRKNYAMPKEAIEGNHCVKVRACGEVFDVNPLLNIAKGNCMNHVNLLEGVLGQWITQVDKKITLQR